MNMADKQTSVLLHFSPHLCQVRKTDLCPAFIHDARLTLHTHASTEHVLLLSFSFINT